MKAAADSGVALLRQQPLKTVQTPPEIWISISEWEVTFSFSHIRVTTNTLGALCGIQRRQSRISHPTAASVKYSRYSATHTNSKETSSRKWTSPHIATMDQKNNYIFETYTSKASI